MLKINRLDFLISIYIFCLVAAELMGGKTFPIGNLVGLPLNTSVAVFFIILIYSINDIITEVYGKERTRSLIRSGLVVVFLIIVFSLLFTALPPSKRFAPNEGAYDLIFGLSVRFSIASLIAFATAEFLDVLVFVKVREKFGKKFLWLRTNASNFVSQFVDTTVFMTIAFYSLSTPFNENAIYIIGLMLPYWLIKCFISVLETPLVYLGVNWLRKDR